MVEEVQRDVLPLVIPYSVWQESFRITMMVFGCLRQWVEWATMRAFEDVSLVRKVKLSALTLVEAEPNFWFLLRQHGRELGHDSSKGGNVEEENCWK